MVDYTISKIFNYNEIRLIKKVYYESKEIDTHQFYNLFNVKSVGVRDLNNENPSLCTKLEPVLNTLDDFIIRSSPYRLIRFSSYFLNYESESFARVHHDHESDLTVVTIVETKELVGGESLVFLPYLRKPRSSAKLCRRNEKESKSPPYNQDIIPKILQVSDGESILYGKKLAHGVSQVESGNRLVFINWYKRV